METHPAFLFVFAYYYNFRRITGEEAANLVGVFLQYHPRHSVNSIKATLLVFFCFFMSCAAGLPFRQEGTSPVERGNIISDPVTLLILSLPGSVMKYLEIPPPTPPQPPPRPGEAENRSLLA